MAVVVCSSVVGLAGPAYSAQITTAEAPPYIPTPAHIVDAMLEMADLRAGDILYDLGSGDGRLVIEAARRGARGVGIEYEAELVRRSRLSADSAGVRSRVRFEARDIFATEFRDASVVTLYLSHEYNLRIRPALLNQLRPGTRVVSHAFHMGDWRADQTRTIGSGATRATVYRWIIPADIDGFWSFEISGHDPMNLEVSQRYQVISGGATGPAASYRIVDGAIEGDSVSFSLLGSYTPMAPLSFQGRLIAGRLIGTVTGPPTWGIRRATAVRFSDPSRAPI